MSTTTDAWAKVLTDAALAANLNRLAASPRRFTKEQRESMLCEAAMRIATADRGSRVGENRAAGTAPAGKERN